MKRNIDNELRKWKSRIRRKPLILRGARQVGKTYSVKKFGGSFDSFALVDLEKKPELHKIFSGDLSAPRLVADLEVMSGMKIIPGKTLLFLDEIQACPRAVTALRYFYEEMPDLHVVAAGSLLEFALKDISFPVGRIQFLHLYPLCFAEYLSAIGNEIAAGYVRSRPCLLSPAVHTTLCDELRRYFFVGGMPECVKAYVDSGSLQESFEVQAEIIETYRFDFAKYAPRADLTVSRPRPPRGAQGNTNGCQRLTTNDPSTTTTTGHFYVAQNRTFLLCLDSPESENVRAK